jgi:predicted ATPase with chaperone activity
VGDTQELMSSPVQALAQLAPRPAAAQATGLSQSLLADLASKHLAEGGVLDLATLARRMALGGTLVEDLLAFLRAEGRVEVLGAQGSSPFLRFGLTARGRAAAEDALLRDGYVGPAPVPLAEYERIVAAQSRRHHPFTRDRVHETFADTVIRRSLLDRLGPAVNSGRPLFIYGAAGTGKSYIARRLSRLAGPPVLVPHAIVVGDSTVRYLDPAVHRTVEQQRPAQSIMLEEGFDPRYVLCERPVVTAGGELTLDMLELQYDSATRLYHAPLQLLANNGLLILDDLGRQRVAPAALFNRWIIPLEEKRDHLTLKTGQHFSVPFDLVLVLSTNLDPREVADDAFLRRIGYKVRFEECSHAEYSAIYQQECEKHTVTYDDRLVRFLVGELHATFGVPLLACHPRDLLGLALDYVRYVGVGRLDEEALRWAWANYFVDTAE